LLYTKLLKMSILWVYYMSTTTSVCYSKTHLFMMIILVTIDTTEHDGRKSTTTRPPNTETLSISTDIATTSGSDTSLTTTGDIQGGP